MVDRLDSDLLTKEYTYCVYTYNAVVTVPPTLGNWTGVTAPENTYFDVRE